MLARERWPSFGEVFEWPPGGGGVLSMTIAAAGGADERGRICETAAPLSSIAMLIIPRLFREAPADGLKVVEGRWSGAGGGGGGCWEMRWCSSGRIMASELRIDGGSSKMMTDGSGERM